MTTISLVFGLLWFILLASLTAADDKIRGLTPVTRKEQLWRYTVGPREDAGITVGDDFICIVDWKQKFVRGADDGPYNDRTWCRGHERFAVEFQTGNLAALHRRQGYYMTCVPPNAGASPELNANGQFTLLTNENEDKLFVYYPPEKKFYGAYYANHLLSCSSPNPYGSETFYGWKLGPKCAWQATDSWVLIQTFDNTGSAVSKTFSFDITVGVSQVDKSPSGAEVAHPCVPGNNFGEYFSSIVKTTTSTTWSDLPQKTWLDATTYATGVLVPGESTVYVYQVVGTYGVFVVEANKMLIVDTTPDVVPASEKETLSIEV